MKHHFVIDSSVFLNYAVHNKMYRLENVVKVYGLVVYVNSELLAELERNLPKVLKADISQAAKTLTVIRSFTTLCETVQVFTQSPDPKDNFLFDLAFQTNSEVIVTKEKALLSFKESPVAIHDIKWFKETFPVPL